jgi:hypothetical protein
MPGRSTVAAIVATADRKRGQIDGDLGRDLDLPQCGAQLIGDIVQQGAAAPEKVGTVHRARQVGAGAHLRCLQRPLLLVVHQRHRRQRVLVEVSWSRLTASARVRPPSGVPPTLTPV